MTVRLDDGSVMVVVADVAGKGVAASLIMSSVKAVLPFIARGGVGEMMQTLNRKLVQELGDREFVALVCARFHPATGAVEVANAGCPDPYIVNGCQTTRSIWDVFHNRLEAGGTGNDPELDAWRQRAAKGVVVTSGATEGIFSAILGLVDPGDEVIVIEPFYDSYVPNILMANAIPVCVPLHPPTWTFDADELRSALRLPVATSHSLAWRTNWTR